MWGNETPIFGPTEVEFSDRSGDALAMDLAEDNGEYYTMAFWMEDRAFTIGLGTRPNGETRLANHCYVVGEAHVLLLQATLLALAWRFPDHHVIQTSVPPEEWAEARALYSRVSGHAIVDQPDVVRPIYYYPPWDLFAQRHRPRRPAAEPARTDSPF